MANEKRRLIIKSGNVFDSITGTIKENHTIAIVGNEIVWVGEDNAFEKEAADQVINATEKTIVPGMIECHVHLEMTGTPQIEREILRTKTAMWHFYALNHAQKHLISGFTCVRDCGASPGWIAALRRILDYGIFAGPRLVVADAGILQWGNQEA
ncbi:MAG: amidohydrolase family protein, partial [Candidatus Hermodarchaeota archaeon]